MSIFSRRSSVGGGSTACKNIQTRDEFSLCLCFCSQNGFLPSKKYAMRRKRSCRSCLGGDTKAKLNSKTSQYCSSISETSHDCSSICSSSWTSKLLSRSTSLYVNVNSGWYGYPIVERNLFVLTIFFLRFSICCQQNKKRSSWYLKKTKWHWVKAHICGAYRHPKTKVFFTSIDLENITVWLKVLNRIEIHIVWGGGRMADLKRSIHLWRLLLLNRATL